MNGKTRQFWRRLTTAPLRWAVNYRGTYARSMRSYGTLYARRRPRSTKLSIADKTPKLVDVICLRNGCHRGGKTTVEELETDACNTQSHPITSIHRSDPISSVRVVSPHANFVRQNCSTPFGTIELHCRTVPVCSELFRSI